MKKTWSIFNKAMGKQNDKSNFPHYFNIDGEQVSNTAKIAESFNTFFSEIGVKTGQNKPHSPNNFQSYLGDSLPNRMFTEPYIYIYEIINYAELNIVGLSELEADT